MFDTEAHYFFIISFLYSNCEIACILLDISIKPECSLNMKSILYTDWLMFANFY